MSDCIFCRIIAKEIPSNVVLETDKVIAIKDIDPVAPVHVLIMPKQHIQDLGHITPENCSILTDIVNAVQEVAKICGIDKKGYRLINNLGEAGGQTVPHLHFHLIGGKKLGPKIV